MSTYKIYADSCSDLSTASRRKLDVEYCRMNIIVDGNEIPADLDWKEYTVEEFYGWLYAGRKIKTNQVPLVEYLEKFELALKEGKDVLYLCASSALSGSINTAIMARGELLEKYPDRKIVIVDTLTSAGCQSMIVFKACELRDQGKTIEEVEEWVNEHKLNFHQFATVDDLKYLKNAGRIKGSKAFFGNLIGIKPIFISDAHGNNLAIKNVRGTKASLDEIFNQIKENIDLTQCDTVFVGQGKAEASAAKLKERFEKELGVKVFEFIIGPIIGTTCGPGIVSAFCYGKKVTRYEGDGIK